MDEVGEASGGRLAARAALARGVATAPTPGVAWRASAAPSDTCSRRCGASATATARGRPGHGRHPGRGRRPMAGRPWALPRAAAQEARPPLDEPSVPVRITIPGLGIDLPVVSSERNVPGNARGYPLCDVAQYWTLYDLPGAPGTTWVYAHAQAGMFLPMLLRAEATAGAGLMGKLVTLQLRDGRLLRYRIDEVKQHAFNRPSRPASDPTSSGSCSRRARARLARPRGCRSPRPSWAPSGPTSRRPGRSRVPAGSPARRRGGSGPAPRRRRRPSRSRRRERQPRHGDAGHGWRCRARGRHPPGRLPRAPPPTAAATLTRAGMTAGRRRGPRRLRPTAGSCQTDGRVPRGPGRRVAATGWLARSRRGAACAGPSRPRR